MAIKDDIEEFNKRMAIKIGRSMHKELTGKGSAPEEDSAEILSDFVLRILTYYSSINMFDIAPSTSNDAIRAKEIEIEFDTFVTQPEIWDEWIRTWEYQKPAHDSEWLRKVQKEETKLY
ncbi:MAG: hypothetical protein PHX37_00055 [Eubacteriales bacterium]|nr:hypothetical protein [Eubacteriales bacterium]